MGWVGFGVWGMGYGVWGVVGGLGWGGGGTSLISSWSTGQKSCKRPIIGMIIIVIIYIIYYYKQ